MKFSETTAFEMGSLSPHVSTQPTKEEEEEEGIHAVCVSPDTSEDEGASCSSPIRRRVPTGSMSSTASDSDNTTEERSISDRSESDEDILEGIAFRALSLQQQQEHASQPEQQEEPSTPKVMVPSNTNNEAGAAMKTHKRRIVKAIRITTSQAKQLPSLAAAAGEVEDSASVKRNSSNEEECHVSLEARELPPFFSEGGANLRTVSDSSIGQQRVKATACIDSTTCPSLPPPVPSFASADSSPVGKLKRSRGGSSDFHNTAADGDQTSEVALPTMSRHNKRRRMNRNRAMTASEFGSILSQINSTGSL